MMQINIEQLLGTKVRDVDGANVGRIEEIRVERGDNALMVEAFCIGASAVIRRLSAWTLVRPIERALNSRHIYSVYEIPWQDMDLSDPKRPTLRTAKADLHHAR
jgi:sporulation protein YlmC with PRC-barrel domain